MAPRWPATPIRVDLLLTLPRELRDEIYRDVLKSTGEVPLKGSYFNSIPPLFWKNSTIHIEALEIFYSVNRFTLSLESDPSRDLSEQWGPYPQAKEQIRHLTITTGERFSVKGASEYEETNWCIHDRRRWSQLLELPHLKSLVINMQKTHETSLFTMDFGPIVYRLRATRPDINITFNISFDSKLQSAWDDPMWQQFNPHPHVYANRMALNPSQQNQTNQPPNAPLHVHHHPPTNPVRYQQMGYVDVTDLIAPPSAEDWKYVEEYLPKKTMPVAPRASLGLLSETVANRRVLGKAYVVREPALLRVLMEEHYHIYLKYEMDRKTRADDAKALAAR